jgi:hypothetical protein
VHDALRDLEAALATTFSLDNLQVYGDYLMAVGDPRGELVAVDLHIARHGSSPELAHRRRRALRSWLGIEPAEDPTRGMWGTVRFAYGFVEDARIDLAARVLASPAAPFVRRLTLVGKAFAIEDTLSRLGREQRPWLSHLVIAPRFRGDPPGRIWRRDPPNLANTSLPSLIAATPRLETFDLAGHRLVRAFPHPTVRRLRIAGIDAFLPLLEPAEPMPGVEELVFAFAREPGGPVVLERPWPSLIPGASLPALRRLDLSPNESQRATTDTQLGVFDVLATLGVLEQLEELRLPSIRNGQEAILVDRALARMPALQRVEVMRGWGKHTPRHATAELVEIAVPWPRFESPNANLELWCELPDEPRDPQFLRTIEGLVLVERFDDFDEPVRAAWVAFWELVGELVDAESAARPIAVSTLACALDAVGYIDANRGGLCHWSRLRERVRLAPVDGEVWIARRRQQLLDRH